MQLEFCEGVCHVLGSQTLNRHNNELSGSMSHDRHVCKTDGPNTCVSGTTHMNGIRLPRRGASFSSFVKPNTLLWWHPG